MINLVKAIEKGIEEAKDRSPVSFYGWAVYMLNQMKTTWKEDKIHASDISTLIKEADDKKCPRQLWLRYNGYKKKASTLGTKIMWDQGKAMQYRFSWYMKLGLPEEWEILGVEYDVSKGLPGKLSGHADLVLINEKKNHVILVEIKTQRGASFKYLRGAKPMHTVQMQTYVNALKNMSHKGAKIDGCVLYLDREGQNTPIVFTPSQKLDLESSYKELQDIVDGAKPGLMSPKISVRKNKGPDSIYIKQPWQCEYCDYRDVSCQSALDKKCRVKGIVAKADNGNLDFKQDNKKLNRLISILYQEKMRLDDVGKK